MADLPELSAEHYRFCEEYCKDKNGTRAALVAGLTSNPQSARTIAWRLLATVDIRECVSGLLKEYARQLKFKPAKITRNWMLAASADLDCFEVDADGKVKTAPGVPRAMLRAVRKKKSKRTERLDGDNNLVVETTVEIELRDPFGPEKALMEHFGAVGGTGGEDAAAGLDQLARLDARLATRQPQPGTGNDATADTSPDAAVGAEPGAAGGSVPQSG